MAIELLTPFTKVKLEPEVKAKKRIIAVKVMLINFWQEVLFWCPENWKRCKAPRIRESLTVKHTMAARGSIM